MSSEYSEILIVQFMPILYSVVFILMWKAKMGAKFRAHSSPSLLPSPLSLFPPLPLPPSPTPMLPAVFSCLFANGQMGTWHKLDKCSTAETQARPSSHFIDIYKVPSIAFPFLQVFSPSLCFVLVCFPWLWDSISKEQLKGERVSFSSWFQGTAQHNRKSREQGLGAVGCIISRPESRRGRCWCSAPVLYLHVVQPGSSASHVDRSSYISQCKQDRHTQSGDSRFCQVRNSQRPSHVCSNRSRSKFRNGHLSVFILIVFYSRERSIGVPVSPTVKDLYLNTSHCFAYKIYSS